MAQTLSKAITSLSHTMQQREMRVKGHEEHGGSTEMYINKTTVIMLVWDNKEMSVLKKFCNLGKDKN